MKLVTREDQEEQEHTRLSSDAAFSDESEGRYVFNGRRFVSQ